MKRFALTGLLLTAWFSGCSADIDEANRCYALSKAACSSYRIQPYEDCQQALQDVCQSNDEIESSAIDDCIDGFKDASGDDYQECPSGTALQSACQPVLDAVARDLSVVSFSVTQAGCGVVPFSGGIVPTGCDSCTWANDGECDEPSLCSSGTDCTDCGSRPPVGGCDSCVWAFDGVCDEPSGVCSFGTDCSDCSTSSCNDGCVWAFDGVCDEPSICSPGTDCSDCR